MNLITEKRLTLTPRDEEILTAVYHYRYVTSLDIAHLLFRPSYMPYVRKRLSRLSGGKDVEENTYLCRFKLPATEGNRERIFTLGNKGRDFLQSEKGKIVDWHFRPGRLKFFSYSAILHHLLLTRFLVASKWWCLRNNFQLLEERVSYELARNPPKVTLAAKNKKLTLTIIPDAWVLFEKDSEKYAVIFELDRGMEFQQKFKEHVKGRIELIRSGEYQRVFGVPGVIVSYLTIGQTPEYRNTRMKTMNAWAREVLTELNLKSWGRIFRFTAVEFDALYAQASSLFEEPVWVRPDTSEKVRLFE
jgi:Replication-relaxation